MCNTCGCGGSCNGSCGSTDINLVRYTVVQQPGDQGPPGPPGEIPEPILSNNLFDI